MKKNLFTVIATLTAVFGMTACSDNDDAGTSGGNLDGSQFMGVEVINATQGLQGNGAKKNAFTRADNPQGSNGFYSDGTADESALSNARFIFFDANGNTVLMNDGHPYANVDRFDSVGGPINSETIERHYGTVVLDPVRGSVPNQVLVVGNVESIPQNETSFDASQVNLNAILTTGNSNWTVSNLYKTTDEGKKDFIMSSTVFANAQGQIQCPAPTAGKIVDDRAKALNNPVQVYVERVAAKVKAQHSDNSNWIKVVANADSSAYTVASVGATNYNDAYKIVDAKDKKIEFVGEDGQTHYYSVIAVVRGLGLAEEMSKAYLFKNIAGGSAARWDPDLDGGNNSALGFAFSIPTFHRSFWETVPSQNANGVLRNHTWNDYTEGNLFPKNLNSSNTADNAQAMYTFPNTPTSDMFNAAIRDGNASTYWNNNTSRTRLTKLLLATQLYVDKDSDGTYEKATLYEFGGQNYLSEMDAKRAIASTLPVIIGTTNNGNTTWSYISPDYINFVKPDNNKEDQEQYMETIKLNIPSGARVAQGSVAEGIVTFADANESDRWYSNATDGGVSKAETFINGNAAYKPIIYKDGMSYYYTTIKHLGGANKLGEFGVVRNHEYRITVNSLGGFGTAVYDPDNTIIPVTPTNKNTYMAAQINVLQWRVVEQNVDINTQDLNK